MHINQFASLLSEESKYPPPEKYNVKSVGEYEKKVIENEPEYFQDERQVDKTNPHALEKVRAGENHRQRGSSLKIPYEAYPFWSAVRGYFVNKYGRGKEPLKMFDLFVDAIRNKNLNVYNISEKDAKAFDTIYRNLIKVFQDKNIKDPEEKAYNFIKRYWEKYGTSIIQHAKNSINQEDKPEDDDSDKAGGYFSDNDRLSNKELNSYMDKFFEERSLVEIVLDDFDDFKISKVFKEEFKKWFKTRIIEKNTRQKVEQYLNNPKGISKIKELFNKYAEANNIGTEEERNYFYKSDVKNKEAEDSKDQDDKKDKEDSKKQDGEEDKEELEDESIRQKLKETKVSLESIGISKIRDKELLNNLVKKYPNETGENLSAAYALMDHEAPDTMPINIGGEKFTKKELISILKGLGESFIHLMKEEILYEFNVVTRLKKLNSLIKSGKTKEELSKGSEDSEEDIKGYASQVNRIKERALRSPQRQVRIGKSLRNFLSKLEVPTAKLRTREDLKNLGSGAFDSIINGLQGKEDESE